MYSFVNYATWCKSYATWCKVLRQIDFANVECIFVDWIKWKLKTIRSTCKSCILRLKGLGKLFFSDCTKRFVSSSPKNYLGNTKKNIENESVSNLSINETRRKQREKQRSASVKISSKFCQCVESSVFPNKTFIKKTFFYDFRNKIVWHRNNQLQNFN